MTITFSNPEYLLLLPLVWVFTWWALRGSLADLGRSRGRLAAGVRMALLTLLVLALAGVQLVRPTTSLCTVFAVDVSDSIPPDQRSKALAYIGEAMKHMHKEDSAALVAFGAEALLDHAPEDRGAIRDIISLPGKTRTDIAAGIRLAMASFPPAAGKQIVLFTDGDENLGNALEQTEMARSSGVRISVIPLQRNTSKGEVLIERVEVPGDIRAGAPFKVSVIADSMKHADGQLTLFRNGQPVESHAVHLPPGKSVFAFTQTAEESGLYNYKALLEVPQAEDTVPDNNIAYAYAKVQGKPRVLVVEGQPGEGVNLAHALQSQDLQVEIGGPERIPATLEACAQYDSLIFANVPAWRVSPAQMAGIDSAVRDTGMGFAMIGGAASFGAGGYYRTPIEDALPVTMDVKKKKKMPAMAVALVLEDLEVPDLQHMAIDAAKDTVDALMPIDQLGVLDCNIMGGWGGNGKPTPSGSWRIPLQRVTDKTKLKNAMEGLTGMGDPPTYVPEMLEAAMALTKCHAAARHIILVGDGDAEFEKPGILETALRQITAQGITVSTIATAIDGQPAADFMAWVARLGHGRSYVAERPEDLPRYLVRDEQMVTKPPLFEKPFLPAVQDTSHPATNGIPWHAAPPLLGYVVTTMRTAPTASQLLVSPEGDPVLATWPYGLGRTLAFTSDATAHWAVNWLEWKPFSAFWAQALRWTLRQGGHPSFQSTLTEDHGRAALTVDAVTAEGEFRNLLDIRARVAHLAPSKVEGTQATVEKLSLTQTAPGRYETEFETRDTGTYVVTIEEREKDAVRAYETSTLVIPYSPEFQIVRPNLELLTQISERADGVLNPRAEEIFGHLRFGSRTLRDIWVFLALLLGVLFLLDVAVRRILLPWEECFRALHRVLFGWLPEWKPAGPAAPLHTPHLGTLLTTKQRTQRAPGAAPTAPLSSESSAAETTPVAVPSPPPAPPAASSSPVASVLLQKRRDREMKK